MFYKKRGKEKTGMNLMTTMVNPTIEWDKMVAPMVSEITSAVTAIVPEIAPIVALLIGVGLVFGFARKYAR
jgi:hypothetical protein